MKVAIVRQKLPVDGVVEVHLYQIATRLARRCIDIEVYTSNIDEQ